MRLVKPANLAPFSVELKLGGGVALDDPELWQHSGQGYARLPNPQLSPASSTALWTAIPPVGPAGGVILQLYWTAFDPARPQWRYTAEIDVRNQAGARLRGGDGHSNPARLNGDIGAEVKHFDHRQEAIVLIP